MTCIVALKKDGVCYLAGDRMASNGFCKSSYAQPKVFKNGKFMFGYTTSFRMGQLLEHCWNPPARQEGEAEKEYLFNSVIPSIKRLFKDNDWEDSGSDPENRGGTFIMAFEGNLYRVESNYAVLEMSREFDAVGSGAYHAEATVKTLLDNTNMGAEGILTEAINSAAFFVTSCSAEMDIISDKQDQ